MKPPPQGTSIGHPESAIAARLDLSVCLIVGDGCIYAPYGPFLAIVPERVPRNVVAEVIALINSCGTLAGPCKHDLTFAPEDRQEP
jgi:hypothetical protein